MMIKTAAFSELPSGFIISYLKEMFTTMFKKIRMNYK